MELKDLGGIGGDFLGQFSATKTEKYYQSKMIRRDCRLVLRSNGCLSEASLGHPDILNASSDCELSANQRIQLIWAYLSPPITCPQLKLTLAPQMSWLSTHKAHGGELVGANDCKSKKEQGNKARKERARERQRAAKAQVRPWQLSPIASQAMQFHFIVSLKLNRSGGCARRVVDQRYPFVSVEADNEQAGEGGRYRKWKLRRLEMGNGHTLTEHESVVDFLSVLYVNYQAEDCVELACCEGIGGAELRIEEAENLKEKCEIITKWSV